jgi:formamidopyrimidine-DNA glycosylase
MPELLEVEMARVVLEARALRRTIVKVHAPDAWFVKRGATPATLRSAFRSRSFVDARRVGKQLLLDTDGGPTLGLHLGMSGRVIVDGVEAGDPLVYASNRDVPEWRRFGVSFVDGGEMWLRDPRRLGAVEVDPDESRWGPDAASLTKPAFVLAIVGRRAPLKAVLLDQSRVAGLGNLLVDEVLWRAKLDPTRSTMTLSSEEITTLHRTIRSTVRTLGRRGGSHTGDHMAGREPGGACPADGAPMVHQTVGGRSTYSCSLHQR